MIRLQIIQPGRRTGKRDEADPSRRSGGLDLDFHVRSGSLFWGCSWWIRGARGFDQIILSAGRVRARHLDLQHCRFDTASAAYCGIFLHRRRRPEYLLALPPFTPSDRFTVPRPRPDASRVLADRLRGETDSSRSRRNPESSIHNTAPYAASGWPSRYKRARRSSRRSIKMLRSLGIRSFLSPWPISSWRALKRDAHHDKLF